MVPCFQVGRDHLTSGGADFKFCHMGDGPWGKELNALCDCLLVRTEDIKIASELHPPAVEHRVHG